MARTTPTIKMMTAIVNVSRRKNGQYVKPGSGHSAA
jgi:hypothetical protein